MTRKTGAVPPPPGVVPNFDHPQDVVWTINIASEAIAMTTITLFFIFRVIAKACVAPSFGREDWMCAIAWVFYMAYSATGILMSCTGGGYHVWEITETEMKDYYKVVYGGSMIYNLNAYFVKVALLLIFVQVFRPFKKSVLIAYCLIGLMGGYYIPMFFFKMMVCIPVHGFWDHTVNARCLDRDAMLAADTIISTVTDTAILILPIPASMKLQISWREKIKIIAFLGTGGTAALAAAIRMVLILRMQGSKDITVDNIKFNLFGTFEGFVGLLCTCLPSLNLLINRIKEPMLKRANPVHGRRPPWSFPARQDTNMSEKSQSRLFHV